MKKVTIVFTSHRMSEAIQEFGRSIEGVQFRNGFLAEGTKEPCDFVAGYPIPQSYSEVPRHPKWKSAEGDGSGAPDVDQDGKEDGPGDDDQKDDDEIEVTAEYLESLNKKEMMELVDEEKLKFTPEQKKNATNLLAALKAHYEV
jgi:hypothetical protein